MKSLFTLCLMAALGSRCTAQGFINFNNTSSASSKISIATVVGGPATVLTTGPAGSFIYALFYAPNKVTTVGGSSGPVLPSVGGSFFVTSDSNWTFSGAYAQSSATPGRISGNANQVVNGVGLAGNANFVILGWSATIGPTVADFQNFLANPSVPGYFGESAVHNLTLGDGNTVPTPTALGGASIPGFVLGTVYIPEPASLSLMALGGLACLVARRKSKL